MVDPIEERQPVLHVVVYEKYSGRNDQKNAWSEANEPTEMDPYGSAAVGTSVTGTAGYSYQRSCNRRRRKPAVAAASG